MHKVESDRLLGNWDAKGQAGLLNVMHPEINYIIIDDKNQTVKQ